MNLQEQIYRINEMMGHHINEVDLKNMSIKAKIDQSIEQNGLLDTLKLFGGFDTIARILNLEKYIVLNMFLKGKTFSTEELDQRDVGGYKFKFKVEEITDMEDQTQYFEITCKLIEGEVTLLLLDGTHYDLFDEKLRKSDYWHEVRTEINDIINEFFYLALGTENIYARCKFGEPKI